MAPILLQELPPARIPTPHPLSRLIRRFGEGKGAREVGLGADDAITPRIGTRGVEPLPGLAAGEHAQRKPVADLEEVGAEELSLGRIVRNPSSTPAPAQHLG